MNRIFRNTIFYLLIFLVIIGVVSFFSGSNQKAEPMRYDTFVQHLDKGDVKSLSMKPERGVYVVQGKLDSYKKDQTFQTYIVDGDKALDRIDAASENNQVEVDFKPADETSGWVTFFT
jgi:cell division protease FtsH